MPGSRGRRVQPSGCVLRGIALALWRPGDAQSIAMINIEIDMGKGTSGGRSSKPNVSRFSKAALPALVYTTESGLTCILLRSMNVPSGWIYVMRCFMLL